MNAFGRNKFDQHYGEMRLAAKRYVEPNLYRLLIPVRPNETKMPECDLALRDFRMGDQIYLRNPDARRVIVYRPDAGPHTLEDPESLTGDPVLPGFRLDVARIFEPGF